METGSKITRIEWFLFKMLFKKTGLKKALRKLDKEKIDQCYQEAISNENYELAALLKYYINFKMNKEVTHE